MVTFTSDNKCCSTCAFYSGRTSINPLTRQYVQVETGKGICNQSIFKNEKHFNEFCGSYRLRGDLDISNHGAPIYPTSGNSSNYSNTNPINLLDLIEGVIAIISWTLSTCLAILVALVQLILFLLKISWKLTKICYRLTIVILEEIWYWTVRAKIEVYKKLAIGVIKNV